MAADAPPEFVGDLRAAGANLRAFDARTRAAAAALCWAELQHPACGASGASGSQDLLGLMAKIRRALGYQFYLLGLMATNH